MMDVCSRPGGKRKLLRRRSLRPLLGDGAAVESAAVGCLLEGVLQGVPMGAVPSSGLVEARDLTDVCEEGGGRRDGGGRPKLAPTPS